MFNPALEALTKTAEDSRRELAELKARISKDGVQLSLARLEERLNRQEAAIRECIDTARETWLKVETVGGWLGRIEELEQTVEAWDRVWPSTPGHAADPSDGHGTRGVTPGPALPASEPPAGGVPEGAEGAVEPLTSDTLAPPATEGAELDELVSNAPDGPLEPAWVASLTPTEAEAEAELNGAG